MSARGAAGVGLEALTRRDACKLCPTIDCSVEDCVLAVGEIVGYDSIKSASRMNNEVVIFVDSVLSQVPPFIGNEMLARELSRHGQLMSLIRTISLGCKSPQLKHVVSFRRQVFMILKDNEELNLVLKFRVKDYDYSIEQKQKQIEPTENQGLKQKELSVLQKNNHNVSDKGKRVSLAENSPQESETEREVSSGAQKDMERAGCSVVDDSEMLVDDTLIKDNERKRKFGDGGQFSVKIKKFPLQESSQSFDSDVAVESDEGSLASSQSLSQIKGGYTMASIKNFLKNTKGARNIKIETAFPDLQLFIDSVWSCQKQTENGGESFTDQEFYRLKKLVLKAKRQLEDGFLLFVFVCFCFCFLFFFVFFFFFFFFL
ncbi:Transposon TX1 uncharacterized 82 kDa protein [Labeo rohita]|uniref:Transposon TX1 uncharacterized 82 kDa protein n=1 Tax=Labeo rohita TaxID=84645 RepID=A0ABQ8LAR7_LABRO|nr:Transposon TX1 uncharacterized 82 kDa protein [Labeo rohita]